MQINEKMIWLTSNFLYNFFQLALSFLHEVSWQVIDTCCGVVAHILNIMEDVETLGLHRCKLEKC